MQEKRQSAAAVDNSRLLELRIEALVDAVRLQDQALTELTSLTERQADAIGGLGLVLRALMDVLLDQEQRAMLEMHLEMGAPAGVAHAKCSMFNALLDC